MDNKYIVDNLMIFGFVIMLTIITIFCNLGYLGLIALYVIYRHTIKQQKKKELEKHE